MKSVITKPILELQSFVSYKEDLLRLKLDNWLLESRLQDLKGSDFSVIDLSKIFKIKPIDSMYLVNPSNKSITSSDNIFYTANVLSNNSPQLAASFFIDIGSNHFSRDYKDKNIIVIDSNGNLVGKVVKESISANGSLVQLISDINSRVIVDKKEVSNSTSLLVPLSSNKFELIGNNNYNIFKGDTLYTSYKSDIYIKDIPVCKVVSVADKASDNSFKKIIVELLSDLRNIEYVFVVESDFENNRVKY